MDDQRHCGYVKGKTYTNGLACSTTVLVPPRSCDHMFDSYYSVRLSSRVQHLDQPSGTVFLS